MPKANMPKNTEFTAAEMQVLGYLEIEGYYKPGSFTCHLIEAMFHADMQNAAKLHRVYPELVDAVKAWQYGDLSERVTKSKGLTTW